MVANGALKAGRLAFLKYVGLLLFALGSMMLAGCISSRSDYFGRKEPDPVESWELLPFYGETRVSVLQDGTDSPIPEAILQVSHLYLEDMDSEKKVKGDQSGHIIFHQIRKFTTYLGDGPPPPTFTFTAPNHEPKTFTIEELISGTTIDPYSHDNLPTTTYTHPDGQEEEMPVHTFTVQLVATDPSQPLPTPVPPTPTPTSTSTPVPVSAPPGQILFAYGPNDADSTDLYMIDSDGTNLQQLTDLSGKASTPQFSPDGTQIIFSFADGSTGEAEQIYLLNHDGSDLTHLTGTPNDKRIPVWSPDGRSITFFELQEGDLLAITILQLETMTTRTVYTAEPSSQPVYLAYSPAGDYLAFTAAVPSTETASKLHRQLFTVKTDGTELVEIHPQNLGGEFSAWAPNGHQLAFTSWPVGSSNKSDIYSVAANGDNLTQLTDGSITNFMPIWSPDGTQLAYASSPSESGTMTLVLADADGSNPVPVIKDFQYLIHLSWLPESRWLLTYAKLPDETVQFFLIDTVTRQWVRVTDLDGRLSLPDWHSDP